MAKKKWIIERIPHHIIDFGRGGYQITDGNNIIAVAWLKSDAIKICEALNPVGGV